MGTSLENIIFFGEDPQSSQEDLPWIKDWAKGSKSPSESMEVFTIYSGDKGLLLETGSYKAFIFRRESTYGFLIEALEQWISTKEEVAPLIIAATTKGKAQYGLHQEKPKVIWIFDENKYKSVRVDGKLSVIKHKTNPFLQSNSPAEGTATPEQPQKSTATNEQAAAPRKASKGT